MLFHFHPLPLIVVAALTLCACGSGNEPTTPRIETRPINDTGVTACFDSEAGGVACPVTLAPGQDAEFGRDARRADLAKTGAGRAGFDFSKLGATGDPLAIQGNLWDARGNQADGTHWDCVVDHVTGLTWEVKRNDANHARHFNHTYSWYNADATANGTIPGSANGGACMPTDECDTNAYLSRLNQEQLCGRTNWRLPDVNELLSIIDQSQLAPPVDPAYFPNTSLNAYWTRQTVAQVPDKAWYVYFTAGSSGNIDKTGRAHIRAVSPKPR